MSLRAGYNLITNGEREQTLLKHNLSVGAGFSFGSFFLDAAVRARFVPNDVVIPYEYYGADVLTPEIVVKSTMFDALVTVGWRF